jgi:hypothetical protein
MKAGSNLTKILTKAHENKWVALSSDYKKVVDYSEDLLALRERIGNNENIVYIKVPEFGRRYAF